MSWSDHLWQRPGTVRTTVGALTPEDESGLAARGCVAGLGVVPLTAFWRPGWRCRPLQVRRRAADTELTNRIPLRG